MKTLCRPSLLLALLATWLAVSLEAQTATVIPDTEAAQHVGQKAKALLPWYLPARTETPSLILVDHTLIKHLPVGYRKIRS
jgi:hypothetical protein